MEKELIQIGQTTRTYRRVVSEADATGAERAWPEPVGGHRFEHSLSDFLTPGHFLKRLIDVVISLIVLLVSLPLLGIITLAIRIGTRGPAFHNVFRTGMGFRVFKMYGFRTTRAGAERMVENLSHIRVSSGSGDQMIPAATKLGRFLRVTGLDIMPLFYNVLIGDMSLVGTRALPLKEATRLVTDEGCARFEAPAGIWGPHGRNDVRIPEVDDRTILASEIAYAREHQFSLDFWILANAFTRALNSSQRKSVLVVK